MTAEAEFEWTTVSEGDAQEETKIKFEEIGDTFIADEFLGYRKLEDRETGQHYTQARFRKGDDLYFVRANHSLKAGLDFVKVSSGPGKMVLASDIDTGQASPIAGFTGQTRSAKTVKVAKPTRARSEADKI